ncbi:MAG TPA: extracellular solute-binding protein, partial [Planctomycetota bacterium]|nr:extracellular solute-binding protein [Planctomycetota bacterium]
MRKLWLSLFAIVVLALAFGPAFLSAEKPADEELQVISPHWDGIRYEFGRAFEEYYRQKYQKNIRMVWLDVGGGTGEIKKYLNARFKPESGTGVDILFGGGMDILPEMASGGLFEPYTLSPEQRELIPEEVNGQELRDKDGRYFAACLSSFGFVYNKLVLERAKLSTPQKWADLTTPEYKGWVSCGNPTQSGSLHMAFELILQGEGWEKGYATLTRMASNVRAFNEGGTSVPRDVSLGQV